MDDPEFVDECLKYHNALRSLHNSPELQIDIKLNDFAQDWALTLADKDTLEHRQEGTCGENLYVGLDGDPARKLEARVPVQAWYDEISAYEFGGPAPSCPEGIAAVGHFTQLVWKATKKLGVGKATSARSGKVYVVCNYEPAGNIIGQFADNVLPPVKGANHEAMGTAALQLQENPQLVVLSPEEWHIWSNWLTQVADKAVDDWDEWLLAHTYLMLDVLGQLHEAEEAIQREEQTTRESTDDGEAKAGCRGAKAWTCEEASERKKREVNYSDLADGGGGECAEGQKSGSKVEKSSCPSEVGVHRSKSGEETSVQMIPIPLNKCEMLELQREFKVRAKKYHSLHKHWKKTSEKVMEKIVEKSAAGGSRLLFFLETEEFDVGSDDGSIESSAEEGGLESIACENFKLFFNLTDPEEVTPAENDPSEISEEE